jgi:nucleoside 2-deoxyribosyltransferase
MKVYLASSWRNAEQVKQIKDVLISKGHEVDAFCDSSAGRFVFSFDLLPDVSGMNAKTVMQEPAVQKAFAEDKKWLDWADACVMILPAGNSAHLEAGYAKGQGKKLVIYRPVLPKGEFDVMYGFADLITEDLHDVVEFLGKGDEA